MELMQNCDKVLATKDKIFNHTNNKNKKLLLLNTAIILFGIITLSFLFYKKFVPANAITLIIVHLLIYCFISFYAITQKANLDNAREELDKLKLDNKTLEALNNNLSGFRHDFSNIITALGGLIFAEDFDGLKRFYDKILTECKITNNLSTLNKSVINNPAIYYILASKYHKAEELGITVNLEIFINFNNLQLNVYDFCRILGILLDNAIEASYICEEKLINIEMRDIKQSKCQVVTIENTYENKNIDINKLSNKGYTSKNSDKESHGIGLWQVSKILSKYSDVALNTSNDEKFFRQDLIINYK